MSLKMDYHNHPLGHDENRQYSIELLNEWTQSAKQKNLIDIALTDHDRYHQGINFDIFERFSNTLREEESDISVKLGIELDNDPETSLLGCRWVEKNYDRLDFVLGSVHFIDDWPFDHPSFKDEFKKWNLDQLYIKYFKRVQETAKSDLVDGLAHLDLIKIFGHRPTGDMKSLYEETLYIIKEQNKSIEISTAGFRKPVNELYPESQILKMIKDLDIPITIASDAHSPEHLGENYDKLEVILLNYGFTKVTTYLKHKRLCEN